MYEQMIQCALHVLNGSTPNEIDANKGELSPKDFDALLAKLITIGVQPGKRGRMLTILAERDE